VCRDIFETIYYAALRTSCELAQVSGPYASYQGSPMSKGVVQPDMWGVDLSASKHDWPALRRDIAEHGVRPAR
jgi:ribonucleotide reductase alpha subunit